jgi:type I restriction-modification system DNA methylase subunit
MTQDLERLRSIKSFPQLVTYLRDELDWEFETEDVEDLTYEYSPAEFGLDSKSAAAIKAIKQLRPLVANQPWGIFYLDFAGQKLSVGALRGILRGLVAKKRASANQSEMRKWQVEDLLFICTSDDFKNFNFAYFRGSQTSRALLSTFGWHHGDTHLRTLAEYNLPALRFPSDTSNFQEWLTKWRAAFDVEKVTDEFFRRYNEVFTSVEQEIRPAVKDDREGRLFTQKLFNRLMFIYFIQKKGWLSFKDEPKNKYLRTLFNEAVAKKENFFSDRLYWLFFRGMSVADMKLGKQTENELRERRGDVPPLNGGLFEIEDALDVLGAVSISNDAFARILDLFERYNFTIEESTPLDVQVAVDPEMLGKVFEELVTGRHETGSYYTPRPIVSFMCREALKHYLDGVQPSKEAVAKFVDEADARDLQNPEAVLDALKSVRVCDPACGSGAYLLGMLHELMRLRVALFRSNKIDDSTLYERKRWIIENNLYGVDNDAFAVQIACLRLWLSLAIDSDEPRPLPNLDYKIEIGDSLIAPAPSESEKQMTFARTALVNDFRQAKGEYMREDDPVRKLQLRERIENLKGEIALALKHRVPRLTEGQIQKKRQEFSLLEKSIESARNPTIKTELQKQAEKLRRTLAAHEKPPAEADIGFDWTVEFAEVFTPTAREQWRIDDLHPMLNDFKRQGKLLEATQSDPDSGGFDILLANPPYGVEVDDRGARPIGTRDSYPTFLMRATELGKVSAQCCYIVPTSWETGERFKPFRKKFFETVSLESIVNLPYDIFKEAYVDTCILRFGVKRAQIPEYTVAVLKKKSVLETFISSDLLRPIKFSSIEDDPLLRVLLSPVAGRIFVACKPPRSIPLSAITESKRGIEAYQFKITEAAQRGSLPYFDGTVKRFFVSAEPPKYVRGAEGFEPFNTGERIAVRRIVSRANRIMCALFRETLVVKKDLYIFRLTEEAISKWNVRYVLGLLNSKLLSFLYLARSSAATKDDYRQLSLSGVRELPVIHVTAKEQSSLALKVSELETFYVQKTLTPDESRRLSRAEDSVDELVFDIYEVSPPDRAHIAEWLAQEG